MTLTKELIRLGKAHPELRDHLRPVLDHVSKGKTARMKTAKSIDRTLGGTSIFGINPLVAEKINLVLSKFHITPYLSTLDFKQRENKLSISAEARGRMESEEVNTVAEAIVEKIKQLGWRHLEAFGYYSDVSDSVEIRIIQKNS